MPWPTLLAATLAPGFDPEVQVHLLEVVATLREETPAQLAPEQRRARLDALELLESYALAGEFPEHTQRPEPHARRAQAPRRFDSWASGSRAPVFVDDDGSHCAVGYLMAADAPHLVDAVVASANDAWLPDMAVPGLAQWASEHGFTPDELAWIQPSYNIRMRDCANFLPGEVPTSTESSSCEGIDLVALRVDWAPLSSCLEGCGPGLEIWVPVHNVGNEAVERGRLVAKNASGVELATAPLPPVEIGQVRWVGPITIPMDQVGAVSVEVAVTGDCSPDNNTSSLAGAFDLLQENGGGRLLLDDDADGLASAECGGRDCDDADPTVGLPACVDTGEFTGDCEICEDDSDTPVDEPTADPKGVCGCDAGASGLLWLWLGLFARRRRGGSLSSPRGSSWLAR